MWKRRKDRRYELVQEIHVANNPYGYRYNVNHPWVQKLYYEFKTRHGIPLGQPLSDEMRFQFEREADLYWKEGKFR